MIRTYEKLSSSQYLEGRGKKQLNYGEVTDIGVYALWCIFIHKVKIGKILGGKSLPILPKSGPNRVKLRDILRFFFEYTGVLMKN